VIARLLDTQGKLWREISVAEGTDLVRVPHSHPSGAVHVWLYAYEFGVPGIATYRFAGVEARAMRSLDPDY